MFQYANETLGTNLLRYCLEGPQAKLHEITHSHPAIYIISLAAIAKLQDKDDELVRNCVAAAGLSHGELAALVFSGVMTFEQGLQVAQVRAEALRRASESPRGAMLSVFVKPDSQLKLALQAAINHCETELKMTNPECQIANYLYSGCKVIAGNVEMARPVLWDQVLHAIYFRPPDVPMPRTVEPGPGKQLGAMLRVENPRAFARYQPIEV
ncbi:unnamed protein product [Dicrocoelium dendriticum]|nr:unnamed protein product [Dicrocoelium dendriticum]